MAVRASSKSDNAPSKLQVEEGATKAEVAKNRGLVSDFHVSEASKQAVHLIELDAKVNGGHGLPSRARPFPGAAP